MEITNKQIRFYSYNISELTGHKLRLEKNEIEKYSRKLNGINGLRIYSRGGTYFHFSIESQLIRRIKMLQLSSVIRYGSIDDIILKLILKSTEVNDRTEFRYDDRYWFDCDDIHNQYDYDKGEFRERKAFNYNQSKSYTQRIKQYNSKSKSRR